MANRNRDAGHNFEREIVNELKKLGFESMVTARAESRNMDNGGVDVFDSEGIFPYYIQAKIYQNYPKLQELINGEKVIKKRPMLVFHKKVKKKGERFYTEDTFVSMRKEEFYNLLIQAYANGRDQQSS